MQQSRRRQLVYRLAPLLFLTVCLGSINLFSRWSSQPTAPTAASPASTPSALAAAVPSATTAPATPMPTLPPPPTATALPPDAEISLAGPPPTAVLPAAFPVSFYWTWPLPLDADQHFVIYWLTDGQETRLGAVAVPNLGAGYTFRHVFTNEPAAGLWQVWLESASSAHRIVSSAQRPLTIQPGD